MVIGDSRRDKSEALLRSLGRFVHRLNGLFLTGVDVGMTARDIKIIGLETPFVVPEVGGGLGDSGTATAFGMLSMAARSCKGGTSPCRVWVLWAKKLSRSL